MVIFQSSAFFKELRSISLVKLDFTDYTAIILPLHCLLLISRELKLLILSNLSEQMLLASPWQIVLPRIVYPLCTMSNVVFLDIIFNFELCWLHSLVFLFYYSHL